MTTEPRLRLPEPESLRASPVGVRRRLGRVAAVLLVCLLSGIAAVEAQERQSVTAAQETPPSGNVGPMYEALGSLHARQQWLEAEIARLQDQLAESASGFIALQQELREKEALIAALRGQLASLEQANRETEEARRRLTEENAKLATPATGERATTEADHQAMQERLMALQQLLSDMESEGAEKQSRLAQLEQGRDRALSANLLMQAEKRELEGELERQARMRDDLTRRVESLEITLEAKEAEHLVMAEERAKLEEALAESERRVNDLTRELGGTHGDDRTDSEQVARLVASESDLKARLAEQAQLAKAAQERARTAQEMLENLQASQAEVGGVAETPQSSLRKSVEEIAELRSERATRIAEFETAEAEAAKLSQEKAELAESLEKTREVAADAERRLKVLEETHAGAVVAVERLQKDKASLEADKRALSQQAEQLGNELASLQTSVPASAGGTDTAEQVRQEAAERANALRELFVQRGRQEKAVWKASRAKLEAELRDLQYLLAQSMSAEGVYRVKRDDNLGKISRKVYGDAGRWPEIFDANGHLLEDPDRLFPGMTLVVP